MIRASFVQCRVSSQTKGWIRALAQQRGVTESALVRSLLESLSVATDAPPPIQRAASGTGSRPRRLSVRLAADDGELLVHRAAQRDLAPATYIAVLTRAHLRLLTPLPRDELLALKQLIGELGAIGRKLNQIARTANTAGIDMAGDAQPVQLMLRLSAGLRDHVKALLLANERSWQSGYAQGSG